MKFNIILLLNLCFPILGMEQSLSQNQALALVEKNIPEVLEAMVVKCPVPAQCPVEKLNEIAKEAPNLYKKIIDAIWVPQLSKTVVEFAWLPGYLIKQGIDRIKGAQILEEVIHQNNLSLICIPQKIAFKVSKDNLPCHLQKLNIPDYLCLCQSIQGKKDQALNLQQTCQMVTLLTNKPNKNAQYFVDCHADNIIFTADGKISIIDTELRGFDTMYDIGLQVLGLFHTFEPAAKLYLVHQIMRLNYHTTFLSPL